MITPDQFLHGGTIAYTDAANRDIMARCAPYMVDKFRIDLFGFHDDAHLKSYVMSRGSAIIFYRNHCHGLEKNVFSVVPPTGADQSGKSN